MKNILFIEPMAPWPLISGGHQAIFNGINAVKDEFNIFITYELSLKDDEEDTITPALQKALPKATILPFLHRIPKQKPLKSLMRRCYNKAKSITRPNCTKVTNEYNEMMWHFAPNDRKYFDFINEIVTQHNIDIVQVEMVWRMTLGLALPKHVKKVFVHHELRYVCHELELSQKPCSPYSQACFEIAKTLEIGLINHYDAVITLSEIDKQKLIEAGVTKPIYSSIAIVNTEPTKELHSNEYHTLIYVGPEFHKPNYQGVMWFLENCWEKLLEADSEYHFKIIGKWSEATQAAIKEKYKNVEFAGFVDSIRDEIIDTISIVPLTVGSGIRMKILEASNIGVPFVTTSVGVEGLPFINGTDCFIADTPDEFVNSILKLKDKDMRMKLIKNAQQKVIDSFSINTLHNRLISIYRNI